MRTTSHNTLHHAPHLAAAPFFAFGSCLRLLRAPDPSLLFLSPIGLPLPGRAVGTGIAAWFGIVPCGMIHVPGAWAAGG